MHKNNRKALPDLTAEQRKTLTLIYERYYAQMYKKAYAVLQNRQDAEDAVQEAFYDEQVCDLELLMAREEDSARIRRAVDALEPHYREVIQLKYYENKKNTEIAELLGLGQNVVNGRIFRAKNALRRLLSEQERTGKEETE